jgi:hypothetical protein
MAANYHFNLVLTYEFICLLPVEKIGAKPYFVLFPHGGVGIGRITPEQITDQSRRLNFLEPVYCLKLFSN